MPDFEFVSFAKFDFSHQNVIGSLFVKRDIMVPEREPYYTLSAVLGIVPTDQPKNCKRAGPHLVPELSDQKKVDGKRCKFATFLRVVLFP